MNPELTKSPFSATVIEKNLEQLLINEPSAQAMNSVFSAIEHFQIKVHQAETRADLIQNFLNLIGSMEGFASVGLYLTDENHSFTLHTHEDEKGQKALKQFISSQIESGNFAWALKQNRCVVHESLEYYRQGVFHGILTNRHTYGMFIGLVKENSHRLSQSLQKIISLMTNTFADKIERLQLIQQLSLRNDDLEGLVQQRTKEIDRTNQRLTQEIKAKSLTQGQLIKAKEEAEQALESKSQFLSLISHELRTPLVPIVSLSEMLKETVSNDMENHFCEMINTSGETLLRMIDDILIISQERSSSEESMISTKIETFVESNALFFSNQAEKKGLLFLFEFDSSLKNEYRIDGARTRQILTHLYSNAVKFTDYGKIVTRVSMAEETLNISVVDTGIGIDSNTQNNIFEAFSQFHAKSTASRNYGGAGLGLTICRKIAAEMNAFLSVESQLGHGSSFTLSIPME